MSADVSETKAFGKMPTGITAFNGKNEMSAAAANVKNVDETPALFQNDKGDPKPRDKADTMKKLWRFNQRVGKSRSAGPTIVQWFKSQV